MTSRPRRPATRSEILVERVYRVICPQCGALPDGPYASLVDAQEARRNHFADHRDKRISDP